MAPVGGAAASRKRPIFGGAAAPSSTRARIGVGPGPPMPPMPMMGGFPPGGPMGPPAAFFPPPHAGPPGPPPAGMRVFGTILSYDHAKGYGFINSPGAPGGDVYFQKKELPPQVSQVAKLEIKGKQVSFEIFMMPDGKPRAARVELMPDRGQKGDRATKAERERKRSDEGPPPPLDVDTVDAMSRFLEEQGGSMDFGKFSREFKAVKKNQLEEHFRLEAEDGDKGGRWTISLLDAEEAAAARENLAQNAPQRGGEQRNDTPLGFFQGTINAFDHKNGYGFIKSEEVHEGDLYFKRTELPADARGLQRNSLVGKRVEFEAVLTPDGKPRAEKITILDAVGNGADGEGDGGAEPAAAASNGPEPQPLDEAKIQEMKAFLEEQGGAMDYGRFANAFPGVKKSQLVQLETDFNLVQQEDSAGGRWQITLPGVEAEPVPPPEQKRRQEGPVEIAPNEGMWLIGCVKRWDPKKHFGFLIADGADDVFLHRNDLPSSMHNMRVDMMGVELAFELERTPEGKLKAKQARPLIHPDGRGGWEFRRA